MKVNSELYKFTINSQDGRYELQKLIEGEWLAQYAFTPQGKKIQDFNDLIKLASSDAHHFGSKLILVKYFPDNSCKIILGDKGGVLLYLESDNTGAYIKKQPLNQVDEAKSLMVTEFKLNDDKSNKICSSFQFENPDHRHSSVPMNKI